MGLFYRTAYKSPYEVALEEDEHQKGGKHGQKSTGAEKPPVHMVLAAEIGRASCRERVSNCV